MVRWMGLFAILASACSGGKDDSAGGGSLAGVISTTDGTGTGRIDVLHAYGFDINGTFVGYLSSNAGTTCANLVDYLSSKDPYDPKDILVGGGCNIYLRSDFEGSLEASNDPIAVAGMSISCAMGDGEFVLETRDDDDRDYYWSGQWWQGYPTSYDLSLSGDRDAGYTISLDMDAYKGGYIYESMDEILATGSVSGEIAIEPCSGLGSTGLF